MPCTQFEPFAKKRAKEETLSFRTIMGEDMPEKIQPPYFPFFYLYEDNKIIESWGGTSEKNRFRFKKNIRKVIVFILSKLN